ncbi:hypothetical protein KI387_017844, partial [Taxus chinensis]
IDQHSKDVFIRIDQHSYPLDASRTSTYMQISERKFLCHPSKKKKVSAKLRRKVWELQRLKRGS